MKHLVAICCVVALSLLGFRAQAQTGPEFGRQSEPTNGTAARKNKKASATDIARMQRRMSMNPDEAKRDQQMEILDARAGLSSNTSLSRGSSSARHYDKGSGGFYLKKFKDKRAGTLQQKRGQTRRAPGIDPKGKPLKHKHKYKKQFLFF